jgi:hypothetical protein
VLLNLILNTQKLMKESKTIKMIKFFCSITFFFFISFIHSQNISGKVTDSLDNPLPFANVIARTVEERPKISFSISDEQGYYTLNLQKDITYKITVTYLGFRQQKLEIKPFDRNQTVNFKLEADEETLPEVAINYKYQPVIVKQDTLVYNVDAFNTGSERKLRDVLRNLPGVEVDREGNVTVNGKRITRVLVEDRVFFTGDSKLAVNNIPADAVEQVVVLDNYNEVAMLRGLQDSNEMVMNIKLKEDKKEFVFGDIEVGGGIKDRYLVNPKLFYYSQKTNLSFIGDLNNAGITVFNLKDFINFQGGISALINNSNNFLLTENRNFYDFLNFNDFIERKSGFGALNIQQVISRSTDLSGYVIASDSKFKTASSTINQYITPGNTFIEERNIHTHSNSFFTMGQVTLNYRPRLEEDLAYSGFFKVSNNESTGLITTLSPLQGNTIETQSQVNDFQLKQNLNYSRRFSRAHTVTLEATYDVQQDKPFNRWITNRPILEGLIPLEDDEVFTILQDKKSVLHTLQGIIKDYWVLHRSHHLYTSFGINASFSSFFNDDRQQFLDGNINNFSSSGFNNDFKFDLINTYLGLEYKFQIGKTTFKPSLFINYFNWKTNQMGSGFNGSKVLILPRFDTDVTFNSSEKLSFKYQLNARFPNINQLADRFILSNFNSVFRGNNQLENTRYHTTTLSYYKFRMFEGFRVNAMASFSKRDTHIKNTTVLNGIEQFNTVILFDNPEHNVNFSGSVSQDWKNIRYNLRLSYSYNDFFQLLNNTQNLNISKQTSGTFSFKTLFRSLPVLEAGYTKGWNNYQAADGTTTFENENFFSSLDAVFLKDFIFKTDYSYTRNRNKSTSASNDFDALNSSIFYQREDSPWGFEITANNILGSNFKQQNAFSNFLISDTRTFIFPRTVLFKIQYKL